MAAAAFGNSSLYKPHSKLTTCRTRLQLYGCMFWEDNLNFHLSLTFHVRLSCSDKSLMLAFASSQLPDCAGLCTQGLNREAQRRSGDLPPQSSRGSFMTTCHLVSVQSFLCVALFSLNSRLLGAAGHVGISSGKELDGCESRTKGCDTVSGEWKNLDCLWLRCHSCVQNRDDQHKSLHKVKKKDVRG